MAGRLCYDYPRPAVTADIVILSRDGYVLLIRREAEPFKGFWALPGGFVDAEEPPSAAAARELAEETGITGVGLRLLGVFGDPGRDPRGWTISIAFMGEVGHRVPITAGSDASEACWRPLDRLPPLAFDHARILAAAAEAWITRSRVDEKMGKMKKKETLPC